MIVILNGISFVNLILVGKAWIAIGIVLMGFGRQSQISYRHYNTLVMFDVNLNE